MNMASKRGRGSHSFEVSNENKMFFPDARLTKGDLIDYYERISDVMLPHVRGRVVAMGRYPDGIDGKSFFQKDVPDYFPDWIETVEVKKEGGTLRQVIIENAETLAYLANQGCIEIHVWPSRCDKLRYPDRVIFDLDPSGDDFGLVRKAAHAVREVLEDVGLFTYVMTTGSKGLHVVSPLDRKADFDEVRDFASRVARLLAARDAKSFTVEQRKKKRRGRVFIDYLRNAYAQHGIAPYSARAKPEASVAVPLEWDEVGDSKLRPRKYTIENVFRRLSRKKDAWKGIARHAGSLKKARRQLDDLLHDEDVA
jgi:bifunctional non-homologous end joining protein LigD